jgi:hypothetical protein
MGRSLMRSISSLITPGFELEESPRIISVELLRLKDQSTVIFPACGLEKTARTAHKKVGVFRMIKLDSEYDESDELRQSTPLQRRIELLPGHIAAEKRGLSLYKIIIPAPAHNEAQGQNSYAMSNTLESISLDFVREVSVVLKSGEDQLPEVKVEACCDCPVSLSFGPLLVPFINPPVHQLPLSTPPSNNQLTSSSTHLLSSNKKLSDQRTMTPSSSMRSSEMSIPSSSKSTKKPKGISTAHIIRETAGLATSPDSHQKAEERSSFNRQLAADAAAHPQAKSIMESKDKDPIQAYVKRQVEHLAATAETKEERELACFIRDECIVTADFIQDTIEAEALAVAYQEFKKKNLASSKLGPDGYQNDGKAEAAVAQEEAVKEMEVASGQQGGGPSTITIEATATERIEVRPLSTFSTPDPPPFPPRPERALETRATPLDPLREIEPYKGFNPLSPQPSQPLEGQLMSPGAEDGEGNRAKDSLITFSKDELDLITKMGLRSVGDMTMGSSYADALTFAFPFALLDTRRTIAMSCMG